MTPATSIESHLVDLPLAEVECDHITCDVLVTTDDGKVVLGEPTLIGFHDRCTNSVIGLSIGFGKPDRTDFVNGLRHMMYPKDTSDHSGQRAWPMFGRPVRLYVDAAIGDGVEDIAEVARALGFELATFVPDEPCLQGAIDSLLETVHAARHSSTAAPTVDLSTLRDFVTSWVTGHNNSKEHARLGDARDPKKTPEAAWRDGIERVLMAPLPLGETFVDLMGDSKRLPVTAKGIRWDHIQYQSPALAAIMRHPDYRVGRGRHHGGCLVHRDPFDLGHVYIRHPGDDHILKVPATNQGYAEGLTAHRHAITMASAKRQALKAAQDFVDVPAPNHASV